MSEFCVIITSTDNAELAKKMAIRILQERVAPCVQIDKMKSIYRWNGSIKQLEEYRLVIKALSSRYREIEEIIFSEHSYKIPEVIMFHIEDGFEDYFNWIRVESKKKANKKRL